MFITGDQTGVAYLAHIGGFLAGYLFSVLFLRNEIRWNPLSFLSGRSGGSSNGFRFRQDYPFRPKEDEGGAKKESPGRGPVTQRELDFLLDKISREGINSLSGRRWSVSVRPGHRCAAVSKTNGLSCGRGFAIANTRRQTGIQAGSRSPSVVFPVLPRRRRTRSARS